MNPRVAIVALISLCAVATAHAELASVTELTRELEHGDHPGIESFILQTNGEVVGRYVAPKLNSAPPDLRSATKSITALLVGIAIDRGEIPSVRANIAELLPPRYRELLLKDPAKAKITIEDLLTMRSGLACDDWDEKSPGHEDKMYQQRDWVAFWASQPMQRAPGERFSYCTGNVMALGALLAQVTGMPADQYAAAHLFEPLGIRRADWARWNRGKQVDTGGHLRLAPDDLLRVGELVLARGNAHGVTGDVRVVSEAWISAMTTPHADIPGRAQQYGYLWWLDRTRSAGLPETALWWAQGNGGTLLVVLPGVKSVLVVTGTRFNRPDMLEGMFWLRDRVLPGMK
jgi:CubicO group peptidase (beta-lactamase class C family)